MDVFSHFDAVVSLREKGFVKAMTNNEKVLGVELTAKGHSYMNCYPRLVNPVNWSKVAAVGATITAIAAVVALFVACKR